MNMPLKVFEEFLSPLQESDAEGLRRASDNSLIPTSRTSALNKYTYTVKGGSVTDRLFKLDALDPPAPPPKESPPEETRSARATCTRWSGSSSRARRASAPST